MFVRSPAYEALKDFKIMQLPSLATLQAYTGAFLHEAGACPESIASQVTKYHAFKNHAEQRIKKYLKLTVLLFLMKLRLSLHLCGIPEVTVLLD